MIKYYLRLSLRRLLKFRTNSLINILGLGIAVTVCLIIFMFSIYHFSFDRYVKNGENTYRLISRYGDGTYNSNTFACFNEILPEFSEVESYTSCFSQHQINEIFVDNRTLKVNEAIFINSSFFDFFSAEIIEGVKESVDQPNTMMVTPEMARKLYPNTTSIGKTVFLRAFTANHDSLIAFTITGIVKPLPETSHIGYEILISQKGHFTPTVEHIKKRKVFSSNVYLKLFPNTNVNELERKLEKKAGDYLDGVPGPPASAFNSHLQPLYNIHFATNTIMELRPVIRSSILNILLLVGLLVFIIASVNFINMYIAQVAFHRKESGIIRYLGGKKLQQFGNMFTEIIISITISFIFSLLLLFVFNKFVTSVFANWSLKLNTFLFWLMYLGLYLGVIAISFVLSFTNFSELIRPIKQTVHPGRNRKLVSLVVFQFVIVIALVGFTLLVNKQLRYIKNKALGYEPENTIVIQMPQQNEKVSLFRDELKKSSFILSASVVQHYPGFRLQDMNFSNRGLSFPFKFGFIDRFAIQTLNIETIKYFSPQREKATEGWYINQTFYNRLKEYYTDEQIAMGNFPADESSEQDQSRTKFIVLGVMSDFNYESLHSMIESFAFFVRSEPVTARIVLAKFEQSKVKEVTAAVEEKMAEFFPEQPVNYSFLDEQLNNQYTSEQTLMGLINFFSILAMLIACMGLIGLSIFITDGRTKEIGIRKVNGAKINEVMFMFNKDFIKWVGFAFIIAIPFSLYAMDKWLENFAYKTELSWWIFVLAGLLAIGIALLTVSWQTWKAARRNPLEALRYE